MDTQIIQKQEETVVEDNSIVYESQGKDLDNEAN